MSALPHRSPAERLTLIIDLLCRATAARSAGGLLAAPLILLIWTRLRRLGTRFVRLVARIEAGTPKAPPRHRRSPRKPTARPPRLPQGIAWLPRLVPEAASGRAQLQHLLTDPEMTALIAADPRMGRLLRPLCRMLGITPPPALALPPRQVRRAAAPRPAAAAPSAAAPSGAAPSGAAPPRAAPLPRSPAAAPMPRATACGPPVPA